MIDFVVSVLQPLIEFLLVCNEVFLFVRVLH
jgi:hypothetical protein